MLGHGPLPRIGSPRVGSSILTHRMLECAGEAAEGLRMRLQATIQLRLILHSTYLLAQSISV